MRAFENECFFCCFCCSENNCFFVVVFAVFLLFSVSKLKFHLKTKCNILCRNVLCSLHLYTFTITYQSTNTSTLIFTLYVKCYKTIFQISFVLKSSVTHTKNIYNIIQQHQQQQHKQ